MRVQYEVVQQCLKELNDWSKSQVPNLSQEMIDNYKKGVIVQYDCSDVQDTDMSQDFDELHDLCFVLHEELFKMFISSIDQNDDLESDPNDYTTESLLEWFQDDLANFNFYKLKNSEKIKTIDEAIKAVQPLTFWMPLSMCIQGDWFETSHLGALDEDGNINGVRF